MMRRAKEISNLEVADDIHHDDVAPPGSGSMTSLRSKPLSRSRGTAMAHRMSCNGFLMMGGTLGRPCWSVG